MCCIGKNCEKDVDDCAGVKCYNDGVCVDLLNNFTCDCHPGFRGPFCEENIDECKQQPCKNGGLCIDGIAGYTCQCMEKWTGKLVNLELLIFVRPKPMNTIERGCFLFA